MDNTSFEKMNAAEERLKKLRLGYAARLPARVKELTGLWLGCLTHWEWDAIRKIRFITHKLAGSGATFGLPEISRLSSEIEIILELWLSEKKAPDRSRVQDMDLRLKQLSGVAAMSSELLKGKDEEAGTPAAVRSIRANTSGKLTGRVLVVDDDKELAEVIGVHLNRSGLECVYAENGEEALRIVESYSPDLILLDVLMPKMNGFELCDRLRRIGSLANIPVIFVTSMGQEEQVLRAYELGADDYVTKPFNHRVLLAKVKKAITSHKREQSLLGEIAPGRLLDDRYEVTRELGQGGMSIVYLVYDRKLKKQLSLKALTIKDVNQEQSLERFLREFKALAQFDHPHLIQVYESGRYGHHHYYTMDYMPGGSLCDRLQKFGPLSPRLALNWTSKIAEALQYAHFHDILHRDLKTENILFSLQGEPIVTDFGLVLNFRSNSKQRLTREGFVIGTPYCMSPEQLQHPDDIDARSDLFSLGLMLFEMLTARSPFTNESEAEAMVKIMTQDLPAPNQINPNIPKIANEVCRKALARNREHRFQTAAEMALACRHAFFALGPAQQS